MTSAATSATPKPLIFARQIAGMAILALANPLVWYSHEPVVRWLESWCVPVLIALAVFGLYALFFTKRAKQAWPGRFFMLAWVLVVLTAARPWINLNKGGAAPVAVQAPNSAIENAKRVEPSSQQTDRFGGVPVETGQPR